MRRGQQLYDDGRRHDFGHPFPGFLRAEQLGGVVADDAFELQIAKEELHRDHVPGDAGGRELGRSVATNRHHAGLGHRELCVFAVSSLSCTQPLRLGLVQAEIIERTRIVGRVSMDMICVDLSNLPQARVGSAATLWGEGLSADEVAAAAGTLSYELLCALAARVPVGEAA